MVVRQNSVKNRENKEIIIDIIKEKYSITEEELLQLLKQRKEQKKETAEISLNILSLLSISPLESIVRYLKDKHFLNYKEIAIILNRDERTIWTTYHLSKKKNPILPILATSSVHDEISQLKLPLTLFKDRKLSILEHTVQYLKDTYFLKFSQIARLLNKDPRTIWTSYNRARQKTKKSEMQKNE